VVVPVAAVGAAEIVLGIAKNHAHNRAPLRSEGMTEAGLARLPIACETITSQSASS
jgi:hypothetical protein